jgi:hypothetical protein
MFNFRFRNFTLFPFGFQNIVMVYQANSCNVWDQIEVCKYLMPSRYCIIGHCLGRKVESLDNGSAAATFQIEAPLELSKRHDLLFFLFLLICEFHTFP